MSFPKHKKPEKRPVSQGTSKKSATRKGAARPAAKAKSAATGERRVDPRKAGERKVEGRRGEPRALDDKKRDQKRGDRKATGPREQADERKQGERKLSPRRTGAHGHTHSVAVGGRRGATRGLAPTRAGGAYRKLQGQQTAPREADLSKRALGRASEERRANPRVGGGGSKPKSRYLDPRKGGARSAEPRPDAPSRDARGAGQKPAPRHGEPRRGQGAKGEGRAALARGTARFDRGGGERGATSADARKGARSFREPATTRRDAGEKFAGKSAKKPAGGRFAGTGAKKPAGGRLAGTSAKKPSGDRFGQRVDGLHDGSRLLQKRRPKASEAFVADTRAQSPETEAEPKPSRGRPFRPRPSLPAVLLRADKPVERKRPDMGEEPHPGHFLLTCREGSEQDLIDELVLGGIVDPPPRVLGPALVLAPKVPRLEKRPIELTFARQGFPIVQSVHAHDLDEISHRISRSLRGQLEKAREYALHVWVPDSELGNPLAAMALELEAKVTAQLDQALPEAKRVDDTALRRHGSVLFAQVCLIDPERAVAGVTYSNAALSLARGGRTRVRVSGHFPSRAARKLEEAFAWLGVEPGPGELCVDLGAAPGGWTYVLAERRARVIAVDPAHLRPEILAKKGVSHVQQSAFDYKPDVEVDWLFCDMAWRPLEAAALLAKWGRNRWARLMIANIKLPMTKKAEIVARVKHILETEGDWKNIRVKQLYHDRDEVTLSAHVQ